MEKEKYYTEELKAIEQVRQEFVPSYYKGEKIERIIFGISLAALILSILILPRFWDFGKTFVFILSIVVAVILIAYAVIAKRKVSEAAQKFFSTYYRESNKFAFDQKGVKNLIPQEPSAIDRILFDENALFKDIIQVNSKGYHTLEYNKLPLSVCDAAAMVRDGKKMRVSFVGKYLFAKANYSKKERIVVYLKGEGTVLPPTNLDGLKQVLDNEAMTIYSENNEWKKVLTPDILKKISAIKTNKILVDLSIAIHNGHQFVCMGYDDPLMVPPFDKEFDPKPLEQYKQEAALVLQLMEALA